MSWKISCLVEMWRHKPDLPEGETPSRVW